MSSSTNGLPGASENLALVVLRPFGLGVVLLLISTYTLPISGKVSRPRWPAYIRLLLAPFALWAFYDASLGHFPSREVTSLAVSTLIFNRALGVHDNLYLEHWCRWGMVVILYDTCY